MKYRPTIGLEVHAELSTRTKMFCESANNPDEERPNTNVCPICLAHPGTLPTINREAVRHILRMGAAVGGTIASFSEFDRKNYFYPDIPKGYQISQYEHPLVKGGTLAGVSITRIHLEEDTARSVHTGEGSRVDFNRAGIPLMELVTEPVIPDAETAGLFARELQLLLRTLGASAANLEKGEMRLEANVSVSKEEGKLGLNQSEGLIGRTGQRPVLGTKVEVKNLNSFRSVERAIEFEIRRQTALLEQGGVVRQETRGWNEEKQETFHQRFKEGSADYRYFPEPDLPKLVLSDIPEYAPEVLRASLPEMPWARRERYIKSGLKTSDAAFLSASPERFAFFDAVMANLGGDSRTTALAANYAVSDIAGIFASREAGEDWSKIDPTAFGKLIRLVAEDKLSSRGAKETLVQFIDSGGDPEAIATESGLIQIHDRGALESAVQAVLREEEGPVREYRSGKIAVLKYLVGKVMKSTKGAGNPKAIEEILIEALR